MEKKLFKSPLSKQYWLSAAKEAKNLRALTFTALMIALHILLGMMYIPVSENLRVVFGFVATSIVGLVCGPIMGLAAGAISDTVAYIIAPSGVYFPGYMISTMLSFFVFGLFFYRQKITLWRIIIAKFIVTYGINVALGTLWSSMLFGKGYMYYLTKSLIKNTILFPIEIIMLFVLLKALTPALERMGLIGKKY